MPDDRDKLPDGRAANDDYLWDGSGRPDSDVQRLESLLSRYRSNAPAPNFSEIAAERPPQFARPRRATFVRWILPVAAAAAVALAIGAGVWMRRASGPANSKSGWEVAWQSGTPQVGAREIDSATQNARLGVGEDLVTGAGSRAAIQDADTGEVDVEPDSRVRLLESGNARKHIALERGTIHATIWAAPGEFVVDTPSATAVDLGCEYTMHTDESGSGIIRTMRGWVGFAHDGRESFIPAGAVCLMHAQAGPGTPYFVDASPAFRAALNQFDFEASTPEARDAALATILSESRQQDALTLWHLLSRASDAERPRVYERLAALVPPPSGVSRDAVLRLDASALDSWWNELGFGDIELWRHWERSWTQTEKSKP